MKRFLAFLSGAALALVACATPRPARSQAAGPTYTYHDVGSFIDPGDYHRLLNNAVTGLLQDGDGVLWIGTPGGVTRYDGNVWSTLTSADGIEANTVWSTVQDRDGAFWFSTEKGLTRYRPDRRILPKSPRLTILAISASADTSVVLKMAAASSALSTLHSQR